ncbi:hypothetical protein RIF29_37553 [Crotalaria pallida]|uniref:F-box domain-containing protein n=1 Tax=Crotalaria pallida TaxID=3830 RepID=A0AAN9ECR0_CROPI
MSDYIPMEIVSQILLRLPPKVAVSMTTVCKEWYALITNPSFVHEYLLHHSNPQLLLLLRRISNHPNPPNRIVPLYSDLSPGNPNPNPNPPFSNLVSACNGLLCFRHTHQRILCNPAVRRFITLPRVSERQPLDPAVVTCVRSNLRLSGHRNPRMYDFYYLFFDSSNCDSKLIRLAWFHENRIGGKNAQIFHWVEVYSVATGVWRYIPPFSLFFELASGVSFTDTDRAISHWLAYRKERDRLYFILSFDFHSETFAEIPLPLTLAQFPHNSILMSVVEGSPLSVCCRSGLDFHTCDIWEMREYGHPESWTLAHTFNFPHIDLDPAVFPMPLAIQYMYVVRIKNTDDAAFLLFFNGVCVYRLDVGTLTLTQLQIGVAVQPRRWRLLNSYYSESLALFDKENGFDIY